MTGAIKRWFVVPEDPSTPARWRWLARVEALLGVPLLALIAVAIWGVDDGLPVWTAPIALLGVVWSVALSLLVARQLERGPLQIAPADVPPRRLQAPYAVIAVVCVGLVAGMGITSGVGPALGATVIVSVLLVGLLLTANRSDRFSRETMKMTGPALRPVRPAERRVALAFLAAGAALLVVALAVAVAGAGAAATVVAVAGVLAFAAAGIASYLVLLRRAGDPLVEPPDAPAPTASGPEPR